MLARTYFAQASSSQKTIFSSVLLSKFLLLIQLSISVTISSEIGQIAYFDNKCPEGWEEFKSSSGRVIVSQGATVDSLGNTKIFTLGNQGGDFSHALNISELAAHQHKTGTVASDNTYGGGIQYNGPILAVKGFYKDTNTNIVGEGARFNIMQPYIVLVACKCLSSILEEVQKQNSSLQEQITNLQRIQQDIQGDQREFMKNLLDIKKDQGSLKEASTYTSIQLSGQTPYNVSSVLSLVMVSSILVIFLAIKSWKFLVRRNMIGRSNIEQPGKMYCQQQGQQKIVTLELKV